VPKGVYMNIDIPKNFGSIEFKAVLPPWVEEELIIALNKVFPNKNYNLYVGMTKTTVVFDDDEYYVLKIPHSGVYVPKCEKFDDIPTELVYHSFQVNYCKKEEIIRHQLPPEIMPFFLEIEPFKDNPKVFIQKRAEMLTDRMKTKEYVNSTISRVLASYVHTDLSHYWVGKAASIYGLTKVKGLLYFLERNPELSSDLSNENLGFIGEKPVIVDYAGVYDYVR
jgi:hypothetical protein